MFTFVPASYATGRGGRFVSSAAFALAPSIRPQVVLFLPALALAIDEAARPPGAPPRATLGPLLRWAAAAVLTALAFAPALVAGFGDDLLRCLRDGSYASRYSTASPKVALVVPAPQLLAPRRLLPPLFLAAALALGGPPPWARRVARAWLVAALAALLYRPLSPVPQHEHLTHPLALVAAVLAALLAELVVAAGDRRLSPAARLVTLAALLALMLPAPPGDVAHPGIAPAATYPWAGYRAVLRLLRGGRSPGPRGQPALRRPGRPGGHGSPPPLPLRCGDHLAAIHRPGGTTPSHPFPGRGHRLHHSLEPEGGTAVPRVGPRDAPSRGPAPLRARGPLRRHRGLAEGGPSAMTPVPPPGDA